IVPASQQTQNTVVSFTPIARESFDGYVDSELRYNYGLTMSGSGGLLGNSTSSVAAPLANTTQNDATLRLATGRRVTASGSRLTLDGLKIDSTSPSKSTQLRAFDDVEYRFNREFTALGRIGYENLRFPLQPAATTTGIIWLLGGQWTPIPGSY